MLRAAFKHSENRPSYADPAVIERIVDPYRDLYNRQFSAMPKPVPKHIWMLWQQGWDSAPPIVATCAQSWQGMNPGWEVHLIDEKQVAEFSPAYETIQVPTASRASKANIARLCLLAKHGGVWADATLFCQQPLDNWLPGVLDAGFFMFAEPRPYRFSDIWFIASQPRTHLVAAWLDMVGDYWKHFSRPHHYYWMEYLFEFLADQDPQVAQTWQNVPKLSALGPLVVQGLPFETGAPNATRVAIEQGIIPVHKLSHKWPFTGSLEKTPVGLLTGLERL